MLFSCFLLPGLQNLVLFLNYLFLVCFLLVSSHTLGYVKLQKVLTPYFNVLGQNWNFFLAFVYRSISSLIIKLVEGLRHRCFQLMSSLLISGVFIQNLILITDFSYKYQDNFSKFRKVSPCQLHRLVFCLKRNLCFEIR